MHEVLSSPAYEQEMVVSSVENVESVFPSASVLGQANVQPSSRALTAKAQVRESNDKAEMITTTENIVLEGVEERRQRASKFHE